MEEHWVCQPILEIRSDQPQMDFRSDCCCYFKISTALKMQQI